MCRAPSRKTLMGLSFFGDALLDQMLSGDAIEEHFDVQGNMIFNF